MSQRMHLQVALQVIFCIFLIFIIFSTKVEEKDKNLGPNAKRNSDSDIDFNEAEDSFERKVKKIFKENQLKNKEYNNKNNQVFGFIQQNTKVKIFLKILIKAKERI